jgi:flagellar hook-basal body complex protein FliE
MDKLIIDQSITSSPAQILRKTQDQGFGSRLKAAIQEVNQNQHSADNAIEKVVKGELGIHEGMIALGKADRSMKLLLQIRNKVMEAYKEISRMPV